jgi:hypothetical protein
MQMSPYAPKNLKKQHDAQDAHHGALAMIEPGGDSAPARLQIFEEVRREITEAKTTDQVKRILALATGLAAAARKATDREMEAEAAALKFEAERRLGQLMEAQKEAVGLNRGGRPKTGFSENPVSDQPGTLPEAGIDKNTAQRGRRAAAMSEAEFKAAAEAKREAVRSRSKKPKRSVASQDTALKSFTARVLELRRITNKRDPERFAATTVGADDLATLGKFLTDLARLKQRDAAG